MSLFLTTLVSSLFHFYTTLGSRPLGEAVRGIHSAAYTWKERIEWFPPMKLLIQNPTILLNQFMSIVRSLSAKAVVNSLVGNILTVLHFVPLILSRDLGVAIAIVTSMHILVWESGIIVVL